MNIQKMKINWITTVVLVFYPLLIIAFSIAYYAQCGIALFEMSLFIVGYYAANISVGVGLHRLWSHGAYKTTKWVEFILLMLASGTLQGPVLAWASDHHKHHSYTDKELDPHSPLKYKSKIKGFFWSHMGWMMLSESSYKHIDKHTMKRLGRNKLLIWQLKYYWQIATFMNTIIPALVGYVCLGTIHAAVAGYVFIGLGRAIQQQITFCVNSLCHFVGDKSCVNGTAGDIWWLFFLLLGENWHNFHHAFARDYRNGWKWYHCDVHKWLIYLMSKCGIAWDLVVTSNERILAKQQELQYQMFYGLREKLATVESIARKIADCARSKILAAEKSAIEAADNIKLNISRIEKSASQLADKVKNMMHTDALTEKLVFRAVKSLEELETLALSLGINYSRGS